MCSTLVVLYVLNYLLYGTKKNLTPKKLSFHVVSECNFISVLFWVLEL